MTRAKLLLIVAAGAVGACAATSPLPPDAGVGPNPALPPPSHSWIPTVHVASASSWPANATPKAAEGLAVNAFVTGLDHPRWLHVLPNGDVLVAETNAPPRPEEGKGIKAFFMKLFMKKAGAGVPSANRITLLRDVDGDGVAEVRSAFIENISSPFGMALVGDTLFVATADSVVRFPYKTGDTRITAAPLKVVDLPGGPRNHHWTKSLVASRDGSKLYAGIGSNSNVAEHGMAEETDRAAVAEIDVRAGTRRTFASGIRNPVGLAWEPSSGRLWAVANERDELGDDLVPDYVTRVREGEKLLVDRKGRLWEAAWGSLCYLDTTTERFTKFDSLSANRTYHSIAEDRDGMIWVGSNLGLQRIEPATGAVTSFVHSDDPSSVSDNRINSIYQAQDGTLWIGTQNGLDRFDPRSNR